MTLRKLSLVLGLLALLAGAAWAQNFRTERPAYVFGEPIGFTILGLPAKHNVDIYTHFRPDGAPPPTGNNFGWQCGILSDVRGILKGRIPAPEGEPGLAGGTYILEAREPATGVYLARISVRVVPIAVSGELEPFSNGSWQVVATGFFRADSLFLHYVLQPGGGRPNTLMKTVRLGPIDPMTGGLTTEIKGFPFSPVPRGEYILQIDQFQVYNDRRDAPATAKRPYVVFTVQRP